MSKKRVVVTGIGTVSSVGCEKNNFFDALARGKSGIRSITGFDSSEFKHNTGGEVYDFIPENHILRKKDIQYLDTVTRYAIAASSMALHDAGYTITDENRKGVGVVMGSMYAGWESIVAFEREMYTDKLKRISPALFPNTVLNAAISQVTIELKTKGLCTSLNSGFSSGADAIAWAYDYIQNNRADVVLAGGTEFLSKWLYGSFEQKNGVESSYTEMDEIYRPFDLNRQGLVLGEGSCMLFLESYEHAVNRKADMYGEILGYASGYNAYSMEDYPPDCQAVSHMVRIAIKNAGIKAENIDYICAEGNGTVRGDIFETTTIKNVFGTMAPHIPISSIKPITGHTAGAAGAFNAAACCFTLCNGIIPPTINYVTPDPACDVDVVPLTARKKTVHYALSNSFSPGGNNTTLVMGKI